MEDLDDLSLEAINHIIVQSINEERELLHSKLNDLEREILSKGTEDNPTMQDLQDIITKLKEVFNG